MNNLAIYNTLTKRIDPITRRGDRFTVYFCGPTVYNRAHIGNFRTYLVEDVLVRLLKLEGYEPFVVRNITDVDDKTIRDSKKAGLTLQNFTEKYIELFRDDCTALGILPPDVEPRATTHIADQIALIQKLIDNGSAYQSDGSVYFRVRAFQKYGQLSNLNHRELQTQELDSTGKRNLVDEYDRDSASDFVLWKARKPEDGEIFWESPWGEGRPGWHIECSAMSMRYLGHTIDLHAGGVDLCFPHHENEIAQSEAATHEQFVRYWVHIAHLMVNDAKMSKSLGNMYNLSDIAEHGFSADALRYCLISGHYRQPLNFTLNSLIAADNALKKLCTFSESLTAEKDTEKIKKPADWRFFGDAYRALLNDLNVPLCLGNIFKTLKSPSPKENRDIFAHEFRTLQYALGLRLVSAAVKENIPENIQILAKARWEAKLQKNYKLSDEIRLNIESAGWVIKDSATGYTITKK